MTHHHITAGQIYRACHPEDDILIRIVSVTGNRVQVVDATTGKRPRSILARAFHSRPTTAAGQPRRTGYALDHPAPDSPAT